MKICFTKISEKSHPSLKNSKLNKRLRVSKKCLLIVKTPDGYDYDFGVYKKGLFLPGSWHSVLRNSEIIGFKELPEIEEALK